LLQIIFPLIKIFINPSKTIKNSKPKKIKKIGRNLERVSKMSVLFFVNELCVSFCAKNLYPIVFLKIVEF
jgi:hypothetical protein